jgi:uncharacterized coiled-coil protein SlyX
MDSKHDHPQPTEPVWNERHGDAEVIRLLKQRISELEGEIEAYNELLAELPDVFERRFQQRLEQLMERFNCWLNRLIKTRSNGLSQPCLEAQNRTTLCVFRA